MVDNLYYTAGAGQMIMPRAIGVTGTAEYYSIEVIAGKTAGYQSIPTTQSPVWVFEKGIYRISLKRSDPRPLCHVVLTIIENPNKPHLAITCQQATTQSGVDLTATIANTSKVAAHDVRVAVYSIGDKVVITVECRENVAVQVEVKMAKVFEINAFVPDLPSSWKILKSAEGQTFKIKIDYLQPWADPPEKEGAARF
jgi:hypothetical protein